ncbi:hypothetical protein HOP52_15095 [Halomonas campisalis]|uniref:Uncharacterized protein n=1 Tax=Billgrantia campisalis TaxID=74661 RepID=A0ABS9PCA4_9GAMM|nr:hypothetical protein [Halomonas campisalis]MCG6659084.1 hypothetical protein [Halomonas campisalis]MDR5863882.1 hypothetical protein [Halomonas campisalis]
MPYREAKEHAPGRLHGIFADPYSAFENQVIERLLHLRVAIEALVLTPMAGDGLTLRVIHGWENGGFEPADLKHSDHAIGSLSDMQQITRRYREAFQAQHPLPYDAASLLAGPLDEAITRAEADGQALDEETRTIPARWPAFPQGLYLYTFFKVYHRLTYGEDDSYRSIHCETPDGPREIHEFHLEEGEFAVVAPVEGETGKTVLVLHESQLEPVLQLLEECQAQGE